MLSKQEEIIIAVVVILVVIGIIAFFVMSSKKKSTTGKPQTTPAKKMSKPTGSVKTVKQGSGPPQQSPPPTLENSTQLFQLVKYFNKGDPVTGFGGTLQASPMQGFYLENQAPETLTSVTLTITNASNTIGISIYTIGAEGNQAQPSTWQTYHQTTALPNNKGYTGTITVDCVIPQGGAFLVNMMQTDMGSATFTSATFES